MSKNLGHKLVILRSYGEYSTAGIFQQLDEIKIYCLFDRQPLRT